LAIRFEASAGGAIVADFESFAMSSHQSEHTKDHIAEAMTRAKQIARRFEDGKRSDQLERTAWRFDLPSPHRAWS
jgi:hypothetical protein